MAKMEDLIVIFETNHFCNFLHFSFYFSTTFCFYFYLFSPCCPRRLLPLSSISLNSPPLTAL